MLAHPSLFLQGGGQKVPNLASFSTSLNFEPPAFENASQHLNSETTNSERGHHLIYYVLAKFGEVRSTHPENRPEKSAPPLKLDGENVEYRQ